MTVIRTDQWLLHSFDNPIEICERLIIHFHDANTSEVYEYLNLHGMYFPFDDGGKLIRKLQNQQVWEIVQNEEQYLQKAWEGPDVPVYIFPSDPFNPLLKREFNGKSGLSFKDKLFLFISENNNEKEIRSLFTHEYNHVCRLSKYPKPEDDYVLLDAIILEGLAENAVDEQVGEEFVSAWASYYSIEELENMWKELVYPNRNCLNTDSKYQDILSGSHLYPKMTGYCVGYFLVKKYLEENSLTSKELLTIESAKIASITDI
ncbi:DUF2268 domain-containing protein [Niallia oryzisoli]|uniref:DUF2268 domain-containing protein n=1 Tax=Niallia oryzisoli TaxID=1737571 RepID=A0ABZ2CLG3_9BACI